MTTAFADTFFFQALLDERDSTHELAVNFSAQNRRIVTTEFILLELGNACSRAEDRADFLALVSGLRASRRAKIIPLDSGLLERGLELFARREDKNWSLTDCTSFVTMHEEGLSEALTADNHFTQAGFTALFA